MKFIDICYNIGVRLSRFMSRENTAEEASFGKDTVVKAMGRKVREIILLLLLFTSLVVGSLSGCRKSEELPGRLPQEQSSVPEEKSSLHKEQVTNPEDQKVLIVTGEYIPYVGQNLKNRGFITEYIETALTEAGIDYKIEFFPWARCTEMVQNGEAWAAYPYGHSEQNDNTFLFSDAILKTKHKFYYLKENKRITEEVQDFKTIGDFKDYVFGGANGYWYGTPEDFAKLGVKVEWAGDTDALLKMLAAKRIDFFIEDELVCEDAIQRLFPGEEEKFATLPTDAREQEYYLIVSKDYPDTENLLQRFNAAMK